jgi:hypothetical protein
MRTRAASGRLVADTVRVTRLPEETRDAMWTLFARFYEGTSRSVFERDLAAKDHVILLRDDGDRSLRGFSTVQTYRRSLGGRPFVAVFSGDTVLEQAYWGQSALQIAFYRYLLKAKLRALSVPVYWFLISKGYRTYLLLSRNFPTYWPRHEEATPPWEQSLIEFLATDKFGEAYQPELGVLRFTQPEGHLRSEVAPLAPEVLAQPDVRFFADRNPGHALGEELCCLGCVDYTLAASFFYKHIRRGIERQLMRVRRRWASASASS